MDSQGRKIATYASAALIAALCFAIYLGFLFRQLEETFSRVDEFRPTRIYGDVTTIQAGQSWTRVAQRLRALGYPSRADSPADGERLPLTLKTRDYPVELLPIGHPQATADAASPREFTAELEWQGKRVSRIWIAGQEAPALYLEPELVATLGQGGGAIRSRVRFADVPPALWQAIIAVEDQHFLDHGGFDPRGLARALWVNLKTFSLAQGGSTLTQQLVKNLMARRTKNVFQKVNELFLALILEARSSKEEILERYLNEVYLGQVGPLEVHGVAEGAKHFFGKSLGELNVAEMAMMAGLIRGPGFYSPYRYPERATERQRFVLKRMVETGLIASEEAEQARTEPVRFAPPKLAANRAPFFVDFAKAELIRVLKDRIAEAALAGAGLRVYTTLDLDLNTQAQRSLTQSVSRLQTQLKLGEAHRLEGVLAVMEHQSGHVRALIGGRNFAESGFNRILNMRRQVGSTFKPLVYLAALLQGRDARGVAYGGAYPLFDGPWTLVFDQGRQSWTPRNYENQYLGWTTLRTAQARSINTIAAQLGHAVGVDAIIAAARALGVRSELPRVPSLALGVAELAPIEVLIAYATLARSGVLSGVQISSVAGSGDALADSEAGVSVLRAIADEPTAPLSDATTHPLLWRAPEPAAPTPAIPAPVADLMRQLLTEVFRTGTAAALAQALKFEVPSGGKTGTTSQYRDAWFAGFTAELTGVVWVGSDQGAELTSESGKRVTLTGAQAALPVWLDFMARATDLVARPGVPGAPHLETEDELIARGDVVRVRIDTRTGERALPACSGPQVREDLYLAAFQPEQATCATDDPERPPAQVQAGPETRRQSVKSLSTPAANPE